VKVISGRKKTRYNEKQENNSIVKYPNISKRLIIKK